MKRVYTYMIIAALGCISTVGFAQVPANVGIGTTDPHTSAILDIRSSKKGILIPVVNDGDRNALKGSAAEGLLVYAPDLKQFCYYDGTDWRTLNQLIRPGSSNSTPSAKAASHNGDLSITGNFSSNAVSTGTVSAAAITGSSLNVGSGTITTTGTVNAANYGLNMTGNGPVPKGGIIMWTGSVVPDGWTLCDGKPGTPDLRAKFIVGADNGYGMGEQSGSAFVTLGVNQIPSHTHTILGQSGGDNDDNNNQARFAGGDKSPSESNFFFSTESQATGGGQAFDNRPPYYALAFIMKL